MKAIVDTTVLTDALLKSNPQGEVARLSLKRYSETILPTYAIKEFKAGPLRGYVWFHNKVVEASAWHETIDAIRGVMGYKRNLPATALQALSDFYASVSHELPADVAVRYPGMTADKAKRLQMQLWLKQKILRAWRQRRKLTTSVVSPLPCYVESAPTVQASGQLDDRPVKCATECCLRQRYAGRAADLQSLEQACIGTKRESVKRRQALKSLRRTPKREFSEGSCRDLGDAVFALDCPSDAVILTTNVVDHKPLAAALGRSVDTP